MRIWITWEKQRRNRELSKAFGCSLYEFSEIDKIQNRLLKYFTGLTKTARIIMREKPELVFCQNPSIVLAAFLVVIKRVLDIKVCVDAHNAGLFPAEGRSRALNKLSCFIQKRADLTIVTNENLRKHVVSKGGRSYVLEDKIPSIPVVCAIPLCGQTNILFICSFSEDEPFEAVFGAAKDLDHEIVIYVTGDYRKSIRPSCAIPSNVILMGYISDEQYIQMLNSVDIIMDLTTRENCLVCGAYEGLTVGKPLILSDTKVLREYFSMGVIYTDNTSTGIRKAIYEAVVKKNELTKQIRILRSIREEEWRQEKASIDEVLVALVKN